MTFCTWSDGYPGGGRSWDYSRNALIWRWHRRYPTKHISATRLSSPSVPTAPICRLRWPTALARPSWICESAVDTVYTYIGTVCRISEFEKYLNIWRYVSVLKVGVDTMYHATLYWTVHQMGTTTWIESAQAVERTIVGIALSRGVAVRHRRLRRDALAGVSRRLAYLSCMYDAFEPMFWVFKILLKQTFFSSTLLLLLLIYRKLGSETICKMHVLMSLSTANFHAIV